MDILTRILEQARRYSRCPFLIEAGSGRTLTYGQFADLACRLAYELQRRGVHRGERVALLLKNSPECALLYFGCLFAGAVAVPVNVQSHSREIDFLLQHANAKLVVYSMASEKQFDAATLRSRGVQICRLVTGMEERTQGSSTGEMELEYGSLKPVPEDWRPFGGATPDDLFCITFTSGTTGKPKGVPHRIGCIFECASSFSQQMAFGPDNRFLHVMPMSYMAGILNTLLCPYMVGASVVLAPAADPQGLLQFWKPVVNHCADTLWVSPTMLNALLTIDRDVTGLEYCRRSVKTICVGTAPLSLKTKRTFERKYGVELFESYGMSEVLFIAGNTRRHSRIEGSVGLSLPGVEIQTRDDQGIPLLAGQEGEICVRTPFSMAGYFNYATGGSDPVEAGSWFPTGDLGYVNPFGNLFITGRKKDLIIRGGINISPRAIEEVLLQHPAVSQVAVIGLPHDFYGEEVVAVLVLGQSQHLARVQTSITSFCQERLSAHSIPSRFFAREVLPVNDNGKVQKAVLRQELLAAGR